MSVQVQIETRPKLRADYSSRLELYLHNIIYVYTLTAARTCLQSANPNQHSSRVYYDN